MWSKHEDTLDPDPGSGFRLMYPPGGGFGVSGASTGAFLVISVLEVVEEGLRDVGGVPVLQMIVVVLIVEELVLWVEAVVLGSGMVGLWEGGFISVAVVVVVAAGTEVGFGTRVQGELGVVLLQGAGAGPVVPPGAGDTSGVPVLWMVPVGLGTSVLVVVALCVTAGDGAGLGEVALGLTAVRMVVRRVEAGDLEVVGWWVEHGVMELEAVVEVMVVTAVLGWVVCGKVGLAAFGVGALGLLVVIGMVAVVNGGVVVVGIVVGGSSIPPCRPIPRIWSSSCWNCFLTQHITAVSFSASFSCWRFAPSKFLTSRTLSFCSSLGFRARKVSMSMSTPISAKSFRSSAGAPPRYGRIWT